MNPDNTYSGKQSDNDRILEKIRRIPITAVLRALTGTTPKCTTNNEQRSGGIFFNSPFNVDHTPSFHVTYKHNEGRWVWTDFSGSSTEKKGGDVFDLVMRYKNCNFQDAKDFLATIDPTIADVEIAERIKRSSQSESKIVIKNYQRPILKTELRNYLINVRCIPEEIIDRYCWQVEMAYRKGDSKREFYPDTYIGFPKIDGNWDMRRDAPKDKGGHRSNGNNISIINKDGKFLTERKNNIAASCDGVFVFEGFMDFLSWLAIQNFTVPKVDVVVLNSVNNDTKAKDFVCSHKSAYILLDNDKAGREHADVIIDYCYENGVTPYLYIDRLGEFNDMNDFWVAEVKKKRLAEQMNGIDQSDSTEIKNKLK